MRSNLSSERIVLVNDNGRPIGTAPKLASHHKNTPLHLAFSTYVFNEKGQFLLTRRALSKKVFPGVWTTSCCGHPAPGEKMEEAITRRLKYELGLKPASIKLAIPNFIYKAEMNGIFEHEFCPVYIVTVKDEPVINPEEVESYEWLSWQDFLDRMNAEPDKFSPWTREQVPLLAKYHKLK